MHELGSRDAELVSPTESAVNSLQRRLGISMIAGSWLIATACHSWAPMARPAADSSVAYERVRVERTNGDLITLYNARFVGDSIRGFQGVREYALPLAGIKVVETNQLDKGQTTAAAVVGVAVAGVFALMISFLIAIGGE